MKKLIYILPILFLFASPALADTYSAPKITASGSRGYLTKNNADLQTARTGTADSKTTGGASYWDHGADYRIIRSFIGFDTSALPDTAVISQVQLVIKQTSASVNTDSININVVASTQASTTNLITSDFTNYGSTVFASFSPSADTTHTLTLNASGRAFINKTGNTNFAFIVDKDLNNDGSPTGTNGAGLWFATPNPELNITYSMPCTSFAYSEWTECAEDNTQTRTVTECTPADCTITSPEPELTQACVYTPPVDTSTPLYLEATETFGSSIVNGITTFMDFFFRNMWWVWAFYVVYVMFKMGWERCVNSLWGKNIYNKTKK